MFGTYKKRNSEVFASIYYSLFNSYRSFLSDSGPLSLPVKHLKIVDSSTISSFSDILKRVGRNPILGKKQGGIKTHIMIIFNIFNGPRITSILPPGKKIVLSKKSIAEFDLSDTTSDVVLKDEGIGIDEKTTIELRRIVYWDCEK